jgi:hypothetical protein
MGRKQSARRPFAVARAVAVGTLTGGKVTVPGGRKKPPGPGPNVVRQGRQFPSARLKSTAFKQSLHEAILAEGASFEDLAVANAKEFIELAELAIKTEPTRNWTLEQWTGTYFELAVARLPWARWMLGDAAWDHMLAVNELIRSGTGGFRNGILDPITVASEFTVPLIVTDVRIRKTGSAGKGVKYVDRMHLFGNREGQQLVSSLEVKTRGAAQHLKEQIASRDERLRELIGQGEMEITFTAGQMSGSMPLKNLVLADPVPGLYDRISVQAGSGYSGRVAKDSMGKPYLRLIVYCKSDSVRRILSNVHRDPNWQK